MITHYDMASSEPIVDRMEDHESEPVAAPAQPQARLMTVEEANANERSVRRESEDTSTRMRPSSSRTGNACSDWRHRGRADNNRPPYETGRHAGRTG